MVAGRFVVPRLARVFVETSNDRNTVAASVPAESIITRPPRISYLDPDAGVKVKALSTRIVGVVPLVLPTMYRSSTFPAVVSIIRILNP